MSVPNLVFARRISEATLAVFGESSISQAVSSACDRFRRDLENIQTGRGIDSLLIAIVGAKGQGKTWSARQFVRAENVQKQLRSGDLVDDATTRLVWVGPVAPESLDPSQEIYHPCPTEELLHIGQPYVILDTPGLTDANHRAAKLAEEALSLAPIKLLVVARDQLRAAANLSIAEQIDGSVCIPIVSSVEPEELPGAAAHDTLQEDLRALRDQLQVMAPKAVLSKEVLVPDFEISGDEQASSEVFRTAVLDRINDLGITNMTLSSTRDRRILAANQRLKQDVAEMIGEELPQLSGAVAELNRETEQVPGRVLASLLGSESVLETGVRIRLRARLVSDTSLLWFPYRTVMSTLSLTQGAWDRVILAMTGSVPSLFGALASWAKTVRQNREVNSEINDGIRRRTQDQVEERLRPLCNQFHRAVMKLRPRMDRSREEADSAGMRLSGIEELQTQSQSIFDRAIDRNATNGFVIQFLALIGTVIFWLMMSGPIVVVYRDYFMACYNILTGVETTVGDFPQPPAGLFFTSLILSILPLAIYCMVVLTFLLNRGRIRRVAKQIVSEHDEVIAKLQAENVIRLDFDDQLLGQAEFLLNLQEYES